MTRLDANGEPSMEEILASIRKIIAEDPPGSRPDPTPSKPAFAARPAANPAGPAAPRTAPDRGSYFPSLSMPQGDAPAAGPAFDTTEAAKPQSERTPVSAAPTSFIPKSDLKSGRIEPSFSMTQPAKQDVSAPKLDKTDPLSIDAQLSDLLGDGISRSGDASVSGDTSLSSDTSFKFPAAPNGAADAPASDALKSGRAGSSASSFSPNFTVSRDGFQPDAKFDRGLPGESRDPFDFDLGPSPFAAKSARAAELEAPAPAETAAAQSKPFAAMTEPKASEPEVEKTDSEAGEPEADEVKSAPLADARLPEKPVSFVAPSISATMAPTPAQQPELASDGLSTSLKAEPSPKAESSPKAEPAPSSAPFGDLPGRTFKRDVMEFASALKSSSPIVESASTGFEAKADDFGADQEPAPMQSGLPVTQADAHQREMEDTVAELLRPMLRTWLAENMPRIVERALLRELESQPSSGDRKTAAE